MFINYKELLLITTVLILSACGESNIKVDRDSMLVNVMRETFPTGIIFPVISTSNVFMHVNEKKTDINFIEFNLLDDKNRTSDVNVVNIKDCSGVLRRDVRKVIQDIHGYIENICILKYNYESIYKFKSGEIRIISFGEKDSKVHHHFKNEDIKIDLLIWK